MDKIEIIESLPPLNEKGEFKKKFEVKMRVLGPDPQKDGVEKAVFIDGQKLDFKIDILRFLEARSKGESFLLEEQKNIEKQFVKSVSSFLNRKVTIEEIKRAIVEGFI